MEDTLSARAWQVKKYKQIPKAQYNFVDFNQDTLTRESSICKCISKCKNTWLECNPVNMQLFHFYWESSADIITEILNIK